MSRLKAQDRVAVFERSIPLRGKEARENRELGLPDFLTFLHFGEAGGNRTFCGRIFPDAVADDMDLADILEVDHLSKHTAAYEGEPHAVCQKCLMSRRLDGKLYPGR